MNNSIDLIIDLLDKNIENNKFNNSKEIQDLIDQNKDNLKGEDYYRIVNKLLEKLCLENAENIKKIFINKPKFKISTYKQVLRIEASKEFDVLKTEKDSLFVSLSRSLCEDLKDRSTKDVLTKYSKELEYIDTVSSRELLVHLIKEHKDALLSYDTKRINETKIKIREFTRKFNIKYKEYFIKKYIEQKIEEIKDDFEEKIEYSEDICEYISEDAFIKLFLEEPLTTSSFKRKIYEYFNQEVNNKTIEKIIHNILNNTDVNNYQILDIESIENINEKANILKESKAFNRLNRNYLNRINKLFKGFSKKVLCDFIKDIDNLYYYRSYLTKGQYSLLSEITPIYKEAKCEALIEDDKLAFKKVNLLNTYELKEIKKEYLAYKKYLGIRRLVMEYYVNASKSRNSVILNSNTNNYPLVFDDDNYKIKNVGIFLNIKALFNLLSNLNNDLIKNYDDKTIEFIKKVVFNEGILGCVMKYDAKINIASIINSVSRINKDLLNVKKIDLEHLIKQTNLYKYADEFQIAILGEKVANKIINNRQFVQKNDYEDIKRRLDKATDLVIRGITKDKSAGPYDVTTVLNDIVISRYSSDDPELLSSGIDTNTCFRLDGDDNDFVFYSVLNKNGAVLKITDLNNKLIGRMSVFRQANVLFINGIRTKDEKEKTISKEIIDQNDNIFKCLLKFSQNIIDYTTDSDLPIDFVVCNKAGILESSYFKDNYYLVPDHFLKNPLDVYNEDWEEFIHTYDKYPVNYLQQVIKGNQNMFTTDFGHYPALLIASRDYRILERPSDIAYATPNDIYKRPVREIAYKNNFAKAFEQIYRITALNLLYMFEDITKAKRYFSKSIIGDFLIEKDIKEIYINDYSFEVVYKNGEKIKGNITDAKNDIEIVDPNKKLVLSLNDNKNK